VGWRNRQLVRTTSSWPCAGRGFQACGPSAAWTQVRPQEAVLGPQDDQDAGQQAPAHARPAGCGRSACPATPRDSGTCRWQDRPARDPRQHRRARRSGARRPSGSRARPGRRPCRCRSSGIRDLPSWAGNAGTRRGPRPRRPRAVAGRDRDAIQVLFLRRRCRGAPASPFSHRARIVVCANAPAGPVPTEDPSCRSSQVPGIALPRGSLIRLPNALPALDPRPGPGLLLRHPQPLATQREREHQRAAAAVLPRALAPQDRLQQDATRRGCPGTTEGRGACDRCDHGHS